MAKQQLPANTAYATQPYWEQRFKDEEEYDWLNTFADLKTQLKTFLPPPSTNPRILLVGVGNSTFSKDLFDNGWTNLVNTDYAPTVIGNMKTKHQDMEWVVCDMTDMRPSFPFDEVFDVVLDKAAMDALISSEKDVWCPADEPVISTRKSLSEVWRVLKKGGLHLQVSFVQPHFRKKYLTGGHRTEKEREEGTEVICAFPWEGGVVDLEEIQGGNGMFQNFFYVMRK
jgi:SAM-dependent methyltransferase